MKWLLPQKKKLLIEFGQESLSKFEKLKERTGLNDEKLIRRALTLYDLLSCHQGEIVLREEDGSERVLEL
jgi:hypothetical protein